VGKFLNAAAATRGYIAMITIQDDSGQVIKQYADVEVMYATEKRLHEKEILSAMKSSFIKGIIAGISIGIILSCVFYLVKH
jgi:hypothetical protein